MPGRRRPDWDADADLAAGLDEAPELPEPPEDDDPPQPVTDAE